VQPQCTPAAADITREKLLAVVETELQKKTARIEGLEQQMDEVTDQFAAFAKAAGGREQLLEQEKGQLEEAVELQEQKHGLERARVEQQREQERVASRKELGGGELPPPPFAFVHTMPFTNLPLLHVLVSSQGAHEEEEGVRDPQGSN
jgi:hypothetical protein